MQPTVIAKFLTSSRWIYYYAKYERWCELPQTCLRSVSTSRLFSNELFYREDLKVLCHMRCCKVKEVLSGNVAQCRNDEWDKPQCRKDSATEVYVHMYDGSCSQKACN